MTKDKKDKPTRVKVKKDDADKLEAHIAELEEQIKGLKQEKEELFGKLQRVAADYENYQKRSAKQVTDSIAYEKEAIIRTLLPAMDNFEHTIAGGESAESVEVLRKGVQIVYEQILSILKVHGVEPIAALGESFDPSQHEAMMRRTEEDKEDGVVLEEYQKGYRVNGRVIRPSRVVVNKLPETEAEADVFEEDTDVSEDEG